MRRLLVPILILGVGMGIVHYVVGVSRLWNIGAFSAGLSGLLIAFPLARRYRGEQGENGLFDVRVLAIALSGYLILVILILIVQLIPAVNDFLGQVMIQVDFPEVSTSLGFVTPAGPGRKIPLFRHAGAILTYACIAAYFIYRRNGLYKPGAVRRIAQGTLQRVIASSVSIASMVTMAVIMENSGMTDALARGLAEGVGRAYPLVAPWIGGLGAFMTGSNTNSNVVMGTLQLRTARLLGYSVAVILAAQTAGAGIGSVLAPTKVVVGASTAGAASREGDIMRRLMGYTALLLLLIGVLTLIGIWIG